MNAVNCETEKYDGEQTKYEDAPFLSRDAGDTITRYQKHQTGKGPNTPASQTQSVSKQLPSPHSIFLSFHVPVLYH
jgi:hypothetical protein